LTLQVYELQALATVVFEVDNPSSMVELQSSSTPLHTSETPACMEAFASLQSPEIPAVVEYPTPGLEQAVVCET
jgi:hypothetical protein